MKKKQQKNVYTTVLILLKYCRSGVVFARRLIPPILQEIHEFNPHVKCYIERSVTANDKKLPIIIPFVNFLPLQIVYCILTYILKYLYPDLHIL